MSRDGQRDVLTLDFFSLHRSQALQTLFLPLPSLSTGLAAMVPINGNLFRRSPKIDRCSAALPRRERSEGKNDVISKYYTDSRLLVIELGGFDRFVEPIRHEVYSCDSGAFLNVGRRAKYKRRASNRYQHAWRSLAVFMPSGCICGRRSVESVVTLTRYGGQPC